MKGLKLASGKNIILADGDLEIDITMIPTIIKSYGDNFKNITIILFLLE